MGSFRVAGMMAGSPLGAGVEVKTGGRAETSSCREQRLSYTSPSPPTAPDRKGPTLAQTHRNPLLRHTFGTGRGTSMAGLGFEASFAVAVSRSRKKAHYQTRRTR